MSLKPEKEREEILDRELKKHIEKAALLEIEIAYQKELDPDEMSARKPLRFGSNGQPISWKDIKRGEHIEILEEKLEQERLIIQTIQKLY